MINREMLEDLLRVRNLAQYGDKLMQEVHADWPVFEKIIGFVDDTLCKMIFGNNFTNEAMKDFYNEIRSSGNVKVLADGLIRLHDRTCMRGCYRMSDDSASAEKNENNQLPPPTFFTREQIEAMGRTIGAYLFGREGK